ncbi:MAG: hypothetical protein NW223_13425 [Hyphomicrobiaceae bacterium]|nr:hypothetical protein [Hyphomicrobiaceae bacterium]
MAPHRLNSAVALAGAVVALHLMAIPAARADILILDSSEPSLRRGAVLADTARLKVQAGKSVTIMRPAGQTQEITGPYDRPVSELARGETVGELFRAMRQQLDTKQGGAVGATRGMSR